MDSANQKTGEALMRFWCRCGRRLKAPMAAIGCRARCPDCGHEFEIPEPSDAPQDRGSDILSRMRMRQL